jgi:hypothetical protein
MGVAPRPLAESLHLAAGEVDELVELGERLQALIARLANAGGAPDLATLVEAQAADLLSQRLSGLAAYMRALAAAAPAHVATDVDAAIAALTLTAQTRRLGGPALLQAADAAAEELDMFWD